MTSLLTEDQTKLIEHLKKWKQKSSSAAVFDDLLEIINLQNKVIEKCQEQRDEIRINERHDQELREIMENKNEKN